MSARDVSAWLGSRVELRRGGARHVDARIERACRNVRMLRVASVVFGTSVSLGLLEQHVEAGDPLEGAIERASGASSRGDWEGVTEALEDAYELLPGASATLEYDLGTAYAQIGELGLAHAHLRRAMELGLAPDTLEDARRNQGIVRRRAELEATVKGLEISPPGSWSARIEDLLARTWIGVLAVLLAGLHLSSVATWVIVRRSPVVLRVTIASALLALGVMGAHVWAVTRPPQAVMLEDLELRAGPGEHREATVAVQASSIGAIVEDHGRWLRVRVAEDIDGWVPSSAVARFRVGGGASDDPPLPTRRARVPHRHPPERSRD